jgi:hypothetical protein
VDDHGTLMKTRTNLLGWVMGGVPAAFLLVDAVMKLLALPVVIKLWGGLYLRNERLRALIALH